MRGLTSEEILQFWDSGESSLLPVERSLMVLAATCPELTQEQLASLSLGERDAMLLSVREKTLGSTLRCYSECRECGGALEFAFTADHFQKPSALPPAAPRTEYRIDVEGCEIFFRLPTSADLMDFTADMSLEAMRDRLLQRCITGVTRNGESVDRNCLEASAMTALVEQMGEHDPQAETLLHVLCPQCGHTCQAVFDIGDFFWREIADQAMRLLREVHALASAYCWRERDILAMSSRRRRWYMEMLGT